MHILNLIKTKPGIKKRALIARTKLNRKTLEYNLNKLIDQKLIWKVKNSEEMDINQGLDDTLIVMRHKLRDVDVSRAYDPKLPSITANGSQLNQIWTHLIDNAVDALGGGGELTLITRNENNFVMVEVKDNGPGIPDDVQERVFEPFFSKRPGGSGLGLAVCHGIVRAHGGSVAAEDREGGGTTFRVRVPGVAAAGEERA